MDNKKKQFKGFTPPFIQCISNKKGENYLLSLLLKLV